MHHNEIVSAKVCAFTMFLSGNKTIQQWDVSQLCAVFMVNALAATRMLGELLSETHVAIRDMLKNTLLDEKAVPHCALALAHHPSKLRRYKLLAQTNNDLFLGIRQPINQNKRGTEA